MELNPYKAPTNVANMQPLAKWPRPAAAVTTILAVIPTAVFWVMMLDYYRGGHSGDQLIKLGIAGTAICLAVPLACIALSLLGWERYSQNVVSPWSSALVLVNVAIVASVAVYWL